MEEKNYHWPRLLLFVGYFLYSAYYTLPNSTATSTAILCSTHTLPCYNTNFWLMH